MNDLFNQFASAFGKKEELSPADEFLAKKNKELEEKQQAELDALEFPEETVSAMQPSKEFDVPEIRFVNPTEVVEGITEFDGGFSEVKKVTLEKLKEMSKDDFRYPMTPEEADMIANIPPFMGLEYNNPSYDSMPQGLKEAQQRNGIRDHGLKGSFEWTDKSKTKVAFVQKPNGTFYVNNPDDLTPQIKSIIDRKFPDADYVGTGDKVLYTGGIDPVSTDEQADLFEKEKPKPEPNTPLEMIVAFKEKGFDIFNTDNPNQEVFDGEKLGSAYIDELGSFESDKPKIHKLRASQIEEHGIIFDSKLENYLYNLLNAEGIKFRFQVEYILQEGFVYRHENIRPMAIVIDFVLDDYLTIVDTKGFQLQDNKLKHKILKKHLKDLGTEMRIEMPSSQKQCRALVEMLRNGFTISEPLKEHAATARKNKLKKNGWVWVDGNWTKTDSLDVETTVSASYVMNLPKFEFEELIISNN